MEDRQGPSHLLGGYTFRPLLPAQHPPPAVGHAPAPSGCPPTLSLKDSAFTLPPPSLGSSCTLCPQGLASPLLRCPSQRLLDRVVRRYAEVADAGSIFMDHFTERDKLRLLYTLAVNTHPILLQVSTRVRPPPQPSGYRKSER